MSSDSEARLRIVIDAINNSASELKKLQEDLGGSNEKAKQAKGGFGELAGKFQELTGVALPTAVTLGGVGAAVAGVYEIVSSSVQRFGDYAEQVRDLSYAYDLNAKEASTLVQVLDDARVAPASLQTAFRTMADKGIQPTIENLADLADKFVAIHDPVEKSAFLAETFGSRAGPEMAKALGLGGYALRQYAQDAEEAGLTLSEADLAASERLKQAQDAMADAQTKFDVSVGASATNLWAQFLTAWTGGVNILWDATVKNFIPAQMSQYEWIQATGQAYAEMTDEADRETRRFTGNFKQGLDEIAASEKEVEANARDMLAVLNAGMSGSLTKENEKFGKSQEELTEKAAELKAELDKLTASNGQYYTYTTESTMSANELALAQYNLATAQGQLAQETDPGKQLELAVRIDNLQEKISGASTTVEGYIDNSKKIGELTSEYDDVNAAIEENKKAHDEATKRIIWNMIQQQYAVDGLSTDEIAALTDIGEQMGIYDTETARVMRSVQASIAAHGTDATMVLRDVNNAYYDIYNAPNIEKTITIKTTKFGDENFGGWTPEEGATPGVIIPGSGGGGAINGEQTGYATGGSFVVPGVGHRDRPFLVNLMPGEHVQVTPSGAEQADGGGSFVIQNMNFYPQPGQSADEFARAVNRELSRRVRQKANARV